MKPLAIAALCAGFAASPFVAKAADLVLYDATGRPAAVLVSTAPAAVPIDPFAEQDALLDQMMQTMRRIDAAFAAGPISLQQAGLGAIQPGSTVVTTSFSDGRTSCSRTVTYDQRGGGAPIVQVRQTGNGCDALPSAVPGKAEDRTLPVALPRHDTPDPMIRPAVPNSPELIRVDYRQPGTQPRQHRS